MTVKDGRRNLDRDPWFGLKLGFRRALPIVLQIEAAECGLACLAMVAHYHGYQTDLATLRKRFPVSSRGANLRHLSTASGALGFNSRSLKLDMEHLQHLSCPCIVHVDMNHFVVLAEVTRRHVVLHDPGVGLRHMGFAEFAEHFTGIAVELSPAADFQRMRARPSYRMSELMGQIRGLGTGLFQVMLLAVALEATAMITPFYSQLVIDDALNSGDHDLLTVLGCGFILLALIRAATSAVRGWVMSCLSVNLNFQWLSNIFAHLMRLPQEYFEKRHLGDITSRFGSVSTIQKTLTTAFIQAVVDGLLVVGTLALMSVYSLGLTAIACVAVILYALLRWGLNAAIRAATAEQLVHGAKQQTHFYESARGVQCVKLFDRVEERRLGWLSMLVEQFNSELDIQRLSIVFQTANLAISGIEKVLVIWVGALMILKQEFSTGMLFAFVAYKDQFSLRLCGLVDKMFELDVLRVHGERVADIVFHQPESDVETQDFSDEQVEPSIHLSGVSYRYSSADPLIIEGLSLTIAAGECVAITGASGCGKTTLAKLILGLIPPSSGDIRIGNLDLNSRTAMRCRKLFGTVMQEDALFSGSIGDNICFFDPHPDQERIEQCAMMASIHKDIAQMPMGYHTLITNFGASGLSGGQRQRILLARAMYARPAILVLDEASSHLDIANEQAVNENLKQMNLTRIIIAHRPETIAMASRVIVMERGKIVRDFRVPAGAAPVVADLPQRLQ